MVKITYIDHAGTRRTVETPPSGTVMQVATANGIPGIEARCGGYCACATCQVYVEEPWLGRLGAVGDGERQMLEFATSAKANSRLSCQIPVTNALDGLVVHTPEQQT